MDDYGRPRVRLHKRGGGAKENAHVEAGDAVLRADGDDVSARHVVMTVDEECGKVLAVGEADGRCV